MKLEELNEELNEELDWVIAEIKKLCAVKTNTSDYKSLSRLLPQKDSWQIWNTKRQLWQPAKNLPSTLLIDVESESSDDGETWLPTIATATDGINWYGWKNPGSSWTIPTPGGQLLVGHNILEHDKKFFSSEYRLDVDANTYIDTLCLAKLYCGVPSKMTGKYNKLVELKEQGGMTAPWISQVSKLDLLSLTTLLTGRILDKSVMGRDSLSLEQYCAQDNFMTQQVLSVLLPVMVRRMTETALHGMIATSGIRADVGNWEHFVNEIESTYNDCLRIPKKERNKEEQGMVNWGRSSLRHYKSRYSINGVMPLMIGIDEFGLLKSSVWARKAFLGFRGLRPDLSFELKGYYSIDISYKHLYSGFTSSEISVFSAQSPLLSPMGILAPIAIEVGGSKAERKTWLASRLKADAMNLMISLLDYLIYDNCIEAELCLPREGVLQYKVRPKDKDEFNDIIQQALRSAKSIIYGEGV